MPKDPMLLDKVILKSGGSIVTDTGATVVTVSLAGVPAIDAPVSPSDLALANGKILVGNSSSVGVERTLGVTFAGTPATISPTASSSVPTFTGTAPVSSLDLATPAFSGTGLTAAGQVMTTTDNQTMTLNQCAGMWLIPATQATPPMLILSNTAVTGAPAVLTVQGAAATDAGAYKIVKSLTPVGTVSAPTITVTGASYTPAGTNTPTYS